MIPFYVNEISKFNLKHKKVSGKNFDQQLEAEKPSNAKMEAVVVFCNDSLTKFQEVKTLTCNSWKHIHRLADRSEIFTSFLRDLKENPTMLNDLSDSENEILLGIQKTFKLNDKIIDDLLK